MITLWVIFAVMTGVSALAVLWPLARPGRAEAIAASSGAGVYRAQIEEIDNDLKRGVIGTAEAEAMKVEAARRLLRAENKPVTTVSEDEPTLRRRRAASAIVLTTIPLAALILYGALGSPNLPSQPLASRAAAPAGQVDFETALARIEEHLAKEPGDLKGWDLIAPLYMRLGRYDDAARAMDAAIRNGGASAERWAALGEARMGAADGAATPEARAAFAEALKLDAGMPKALFGLAMAKRQDGDTAAAIADLEKMFAAAPADAPYRAVIREMIDDWRGTPKGGEALANLPEPERNAAIKGMVDALSERLKAGGGTKEEWIRLIRARNVLGEIDAARAALATARERLTQDSSALEALKALAGELKLEAAQ